ncbi:hypothetical protein QZH41_002927 [Actinostola sp. cb2023]|nr:hypothetical protein QZH41_002927 [Actinostola sp. cb2023]
MATRKTGKNKFDLCKFMKQQRKKRESHERLVEVERELCVARKQLETKSKSLKRIKTKVEEAIREKEEIRTELDQEVPRKKARFMSDHSAKMRREKPSQYKEGQSNSQLIVKWDSTSVPFPKVIRDQFLKLMVQCDGFLLSWNRQQAIIDIEGFFHSCIADFLLQDNVSRPSSCRSVVIDGEETPVRYWQDSIKGVIQQYLLEFPDGIKRTYIYAHIPKNFRSNSLLAGLCNLCEDSGYANFATLEKMVGEAVVIIDYKMKVELGMHAREIQRDWYGKRGISLHGFYVVAQVSDSKRKIDVLDLWSDDTKQDAWFTQSALDIAFRWMEEMLPGFNVYLFSVSRVECEIETEDGEYPLRLYREFEEELIVDF